jgi:hypothetical protein
MHGILLFLLLACPFQQGKVTVKTGLPGAEFYLDGTFVAKTDAGGSLVLENFPAGTFKYEVRKNGYASQAGGFELGEGQARTILITLKAVEPPAPPPKAAESPGSVAVRPPKPKKITTENAGNTITPAPAAGPIERPASAEAEAKEEDSGTVAGWVAGILVLCAAAGGYFWWKQRGVPPPMDEHPMEEFQAEEAPGVPRVQAEPKAAPEFLADLRRKEERINAGFVDVKPRDTEKEIVIVLPKEAYRYEDEPKS